MTRYLLIILIFFSQIVQSQELITLWDSTYQNPNKYKEKFEDMIILRDGRVGVAGRVDISSKNADGLLLVVNPFESGKLNIRERYGNFRKDGFRSLAQAEDRSLYLVGYAKEQNNQWGWVQRVDMNGKTIRRHDLGNNKEHDYDIKKILWVGNGEGVLVGQDLNEKQGHVWLLRIKGNKTLHDTIKIDDAYLDVTGLEAAKNGTAWVFGNAGKSDISKKGAIWVAKINDKTELKESKIIRQNGDFKKVFTSSSDYYGHLLLGGEIFASGDGKTDPWIAELNMEREEIFNTPILLNQKNHATSVLKSLRGERWVTIVSDEVESESEGSPHTLLMWDTDADPLKYPLRISDGENFKIKKLLEIGQDTFLIAGNMQNRRGDDTRIRLICVTYADFLAKKSLDFQPLLTTLDSPYVYKNFRVRDESEDGVFSAEERGFLEFDLTNQTGKTIYQGKVTAEWQEPIGGMSLGSYPVDRIRFLPNEESFPVSIPFVANENPQEGKGVLKITIYSEHAKPIQFLRVVSNESTPTVAGASHRFTFDNYTRDPAENYIKLTGRLIANQKSRASEIRVNHNGHFRSQDGKAVDVKLDSVFANPSMHDYEYAFEVIVHQLDTGQNEIYLEVDGVQSRLIEIDFEPLKPNLYSIAIGPQYKSIDHLKFPAKDAQDFADALLLQKDKGFYKKVMDPIILNTPESTERTPIESAFEDLTALKEVLRPHDYVFVFLSGHGDVINNRFRFLARDYEFGKVTKTVDYKEYVLGFLKELNCKVIIFVDACHSGEAKTPVSAELSNALLAAHASEPGLITFASCKGGQLSYENAIWENGAFTEALLEAMTGSETYRKIMGENVGSFVTINDLYAYLEIRVPQLLDSLPTKYSKVQNPVLIRNDEEAKLRGDLPLFMIN
jgi:hypothetical protein